MQVVILGAGYVGLFSGACFAEFCADFTCTGVDEHKAMLTTLTIPTSKKE